MHSAHSTHTGHKRDHNEDAWLAAPELNLWLVADGMGGHEHGEVASALARDTIRDAVAEGVDLEDAIQKAAKAVSGMARTGYSGMGTTIVAAQFNGEHYQISWVGDSRAYRQDSDGHLELLTHDHSYVQELMDGGAISEREAEGHPHRHVITQALGVTEPETLHVDTITGRLRPGDQLLLCSDGLNNEVSDEDIARILDGNGKLEERVQKLIDAALDHGGSDNITVVLLEQAGDRRPGFWKRLWRR